MRHGAARCASTVLSRQRPMDCPFLSYRSCCSPTTSGCRPAETVALFSLGLTHSHTHRCRHTWNLQFTVLWGCCIFVLLLSHANSCAPRMAMSVLWLVSLSVLCGDWMLLITIERPLLWSPVGESAVDGLIDYVTIGDPFRFFCCIIHHQIKFKISSGLDLKQFDNGS